MEHRENDIASKVTEAYLALKRIDKRNPLLRYIEQVELPGLFIWSDKKERLNGKRYPRWRIFYERFSGNNGNIRLQDKEIASYLPELLLQYHQALIKEIEKRFPRLKPKAHGDFISYDVGWAQDQGERFLLRANGRVEKLTGGVRHAALSTATPEEEIAFFGKIKLVVPYNQAIGDFYAQAMKKREKEK